MGPNNCLWMVSFVLLLLGKLSQQFRDQGRSIISPDSERQTFAKWKNIINEQLEEEGKFIHLFSHIKQIIVALESSSFPTAVAKHISPQCLEDSQLYFRNLYGNKSLWALQMQESSAKMPPGLIGVHNYHADGLFDECLAVRAPGFDGQYCSIFFKLSVVNESEILPPESSSLHQERSSIINNFVSLFQILGIVLGSDRVKPKVSAAESNSALYPGTTFCLPSSCSATDLGQAVAELIGSYVIANHSIVTVADELFCFKEKSVQPAFDSVTIIVIEVLSFFGLLVASATIHESWFIYRGVDLNAKKKGKALRAFQCFSALKNGRKILSMKVSTGESQDNFSCIHGIRFFSTCWIVMGNTFNICFHKVINRTTILNSFKHVGVLTVLNLTQFVDIFFLISGLLVTFSLLRELDQNKGKFNVAYYYLHRYLRLTIVYAFILGFIATLTVYLGTGPYWYTVHDYSNFCRNAWWRQFLYINNFFTSDHFYSCMFPTWYLAIDMQLFLVSPILIYPLWRWRKCGISLLALVTIGCHINILFVFSKDNTNTNHPHYKPWIRAPPYLVGIWTGLFLHITKQSQFKLSKITVAMGWMISIILAAAVTYGEAYNTNQSVLEMSSELTATFGPVHRIAWACFVAWIIFACSHGYGGVLNRILSWKGFLPLSRLTYCVYLIHFDYVLIYYSALRKRFYYRMFEEFITLFGIFFYLFALAFFISVSLEVPFLRLEKLIFSSNKPKRNTLSIEQHTS